MKSDIKKQFLRMLELKKDVIEEYAERFSEADEKADSAGSKQ